MRNSQTRRMAQRPPGRTQRSEKPSRYVPLTNMTPSACFLTLAAILQLVVATSRVISVLKYSASPFTRGTTHSRAPRALDLHTAVRVLVRTCVTCTASFPSRPPYATRYPTQHIHLRPVPLSQSATHSIASKLPKILVFATWVRVSSNGANTERRYYEEAIL